MLRNMKRLSGTPFYPRIFWLLYQCSRTRRRSGITKRGAAGSLPCRRDEQFHPLNPNGVQLETRQLGEAAHALLSNTPSV